MDSTRHTMHEYWQNFTPTLDSMMLEQNADILSQEEKREILDFLPPLEGKRILELGAGIGRFTRELCKTAAHVTSVDFMKEYIEKNRQANQKYGNIDFLHADVMELEFNPESFDIVFSNWLLMYLDEKECVKLVQKILKWLKLGGHLFIRESCLQQSGSMKRMSNPTFYRSPSTYNALIVSASEIKTTTGSQVIDQSGDQNDQLLTKSDNTQYHQEIQSYTFEIMRVSSLKTYIKHKNNPCQVCFLACKMSQVNGKDNDPASFDNFQKFLDEQQYSKNGVKRYEWIFGEMFLSTGGMDTTKDIISRLNLKPGERVLDVGSGLGGHDFYMAEEFGVHVHGVDLSVNMMSVALEHLTKRPHLKSKIQLEICDVTKAEFEEESFDVIYSRDCLLHIADKEALFKRFLTWLRPGGRILFTDYCRGDKEHSEEFKSYVSSRGYHLLTVEEYEKLLKKSGYVNVKVQNYTDYFLKCLKKELKKLEDEKNDFLKQFSEDDYNYLYNGWTAKIRRVNEGDQQWGLCYAEKPATNTSDK